MQFFALFFNNKILWPSKVSVERDYQNFTKTLTEYYSLLSNKKKKVYVNTYYEMLNKKNLQIMYGKWRFINFKSYITINLYLKKADFLIPKKKFSSFF